MTKIDSDETRSRRLLEWFYPRARPMPWRKLQAKDRVDPYQVWLSEVMLQQTRVETVVPYFERFVEVFPDVESLAAAELDRVLALWSGLGYYRRARQLHAAAQEIVRRGAFPTDSHSLQELPGIGPYTSAAIASIAFGEVIPVLDGNVERVLSRQLALAQDVKSKPVRERLSQAAAALLDPEHPGDSNQALMELGATVCLPKRPRCLSCPLMEGCRGRLEPELYPVKKARRASQVQVRLAAMVEDQGRILLFRRPEGSQVLAGMWEVPWVDLADADPLTEPASQLDAASTALASKYGGQWTLGEARGAVRHAITYRSLTLWRYAARLTSSTTAEIADSPYEYGWFSEQERSELPLSSLVRKLLAP